MIEYTTVDEEVLEITQYCEKSFSFDLAPYCEEELEISIFFDKNGEEGNLVKITVDFEKIFMEEGVDVGENIFESIGEWLDTKFSTNNKQAICKEIFDVIWAYIEEKDLC